MNIKFNYRTVYFFFLSLCGILLTLTLTNTITMDGVRGYSLFVLIVSTVIWVIDEQIQFVAERFRADSGEYDSTTDDIKIYEVLKYRIVLLWSYLAVLGLGLFITYR